MDCPMPQAPIAYLTFPTVQGRCRKCLSFITTCPQGVHPTCHATWRLMSLVSAWAALATNAEVARMFEISDTTVRRYDKIVSRTDIPLRRCSRASKSFSWTRKRFAKGTDT